MLSLGHTVTIVVTTATITVDGLLGSSRSTSSRI